MDMPSAIVSVLSKYATFSGRASRSEYWWYTLVYVFLLTLVYCVAESFDGTVTGDFAFNTLFALILALFLPNLALAVRRLHDIGKSGWNALWTYQPFFATMAAIFLSINSAGGEPDMGLVVLLSFFGLPVGPIMILVWACKKGDGAENDYGPNPLDGDEYEYAY